MIVEGHYTLQGHTPTSCHDLIAWAQWYGKADRHVAKTKRGDIFISTVFLALDHNFGWHNSPLLYETMIFGVEKYDGYMWRYTTWDEAEWGHKRACYMVGIDPRGKWEKIREFFCWHQWFPAKWDYSEKWCIHCGKWKRDPRPVCFGWPPKQIELMNKKCDPCEFGLHCFMRALRTGRHHVD